MAFSVSAIANSCWPVLIRARPAINVCGSAIARVALGPRFQRSSLSFQVAREVAVVQRVDPEALGVAGPIAQLVGLLQALSRERRLSQAAVAEPELRMGHRKIGIDSDRTLKQRHGTCRRAGKGRFESGGL